MAGYRMWEVGGWEDPWFEQIDSAHKIAFMYLVLGPNARPSGLYVQSLRQMALALNTTVDKVEQVMADFERDGKVLRDPGRNLVWIVNACAAGERMGFGSGNGVRRSVEKDVAQHAASPLVERFLERYPSYSGSQGGAQGVPRHPPGTPQGVPKHKQEQEQRTTTKPSGGAREPDPLWDALVDALELDAAGITKTRRGRLNAALRDLREVGATPDELRLRAKRYRRIHPEWEFTETALAAHWASLAEKKRRAPIERVADPDPDPLRDDAVNAAGLAQLRAAVQAA